MEKICKISEIKKLIKEYGEKKITVLYKQFKTEIDQVIESKLSNKEKLNKIKEILVTNGG